MSIFDPEKDARNRARHGVSLAFGERVLTDPRSVEALDDRMDYGEERWGALGMVDGAVWSATYTDRDGEACFISVRRATARETDFYYLANR